jgi:PleD family two-component response regulator
MKAQNYPKALAVLPMKRFQDTYGASPSAMWGLGRAMAARILIVDDHEIVRKGVRMLFDNYDSFEVCGEAQNGMEAILMVPELSPDVVILDLSMP